MDPQKARRLALVDKATTRAISCTIAAIALYMAAHWLGVLPWR